MSEGCKIYSNEGRMIFLFVIIVFSAFGFGFFFGGCEKNLQPECSLYWIKRSEVTGYGTTTYTCNGACLHTTTTCTTDNGKTKCTNTCDLYQKVPCYSSYDIENYTHDSKTYYCNFQAAYKVQNQQDALNTAKSMYPLGMFSKSSPASVILTPGSSWIFALPFSESSKRQPACSRSLFIFIRACASLLFIKLF